MLRLTVIIALSLCWLATVSGTSESEGCLPPYTGHDKKLLLEELLDYYLTHYKHLVYVAFYCKKGYYLYDSQTRDFVTGNRFKTQCRNGKYIPAVPDKRFSCRNPDPVCILKLNPYLVAKPDKETFKRGEEVKFECKKGYYLIGVDDTICMKNGDFIDKIPKCAPYCQEPKQKYLVVNSNSKSFKIGGKIGLDCVAGYRLRNNVEQIRYCQVDGKWDEEIEDDLCERVGCPYAPKLENGIYYPDSTSDKPGADGWFKVGAKIKYKCKKNYYLKGKDYMLCARTGKFVFKVPVCIEIRCTEVMDIANGGFKPERDSYAVGSFVEYSCKTNYKLNDKLGKRFCRLNPDKKTASFEKPPKCEEIKCDKPMTIKNGGFLPFQTQYSIGKSVNYFCVDNYKLVPSEGTRTCKLSNDGTTASFPKPPMCERIQCDKPKDIKYGDFNIKQKVYYVGDVVDYVCKKGFYLVGEERNPCELKKDKLSATFRPPPSCRPIICDKPMPLVNGRISKGVKDEYRIDDEVEYKCDSNYYLAGDDTATCKQSGVKTGKFTKAPACIEILCDKPMPIKNGDFLPEEKDYSIGDKVTYKCKPNYKLVGMKVAICEKKGKKTAEFSIAPTCELIVCDRPMPIDNGDFAKKPNPPFTVGEVVFYVCDKGYEFANKLTTSTCELQDDGISAIFSEKPMCKRVYCSFPGKPDKGTTKPAKKLYVVGESVTFSCDKCYKIKGDKKSTCQQNGKFDNPVPSCVIITCSKKDIPYPSDSTFYPVKTVYKCPEVVTFKCHEAFNIINDKTTTCQENGQWSISKKSECIPIFCVLPKLNPNVRVTPKRRRYSYSAKIRYYCKPGYSVVEDKDKTEAVCKETGQFSNPSITCKRNKCGPPPVPKFGKVTPDTAQDEYLPGNEIEYECNEWYTFEDGAYAFNECQNDGTWSRPAPTCIGSCRGLCFSGKKEQRSCHCDYNCYDRKDCCADRTKECVKHSCGNRCGIPKPGGCSCDRECTNSYTTKSCCHDYLEACPGNWYG